MCINCGISVAWTITMGVTMSMFTRTRCCCFGSHSNKRQCCFYSMYVAEVKTPVEARILNLQNTLSKSKIAIFPVLIGKSYFQNKSVVFFFFSPSSLDINNGTHLPVFSTHQSDSFGVLAVGLEVITSYQQCSQQQASQQQGHQHQLGVVPPTRSRLHHISLTKQTSKRESSVHIVSVPSVKKKNNHSASSKPNTSMRHSEQTESDTPWKHETRCTCSGVLGRRTRQKGDCHYSVTVLSTVTESLRGKKKPTPPKPFCLRICD